MYVAWYGLGRFFIEGLRTDSLYAGSLRISQIVAGASFVAGLILFIIFKVVTAKKEIPLYVNSDASKELIEHDRTIEEEKKRKKLAKKEKAAPSILGEGVKLDDSTDSLLTADKEDGTAEEAPKVSDEPVIPEENNEIDNKEE